MKRMFLLDLVTLLIVVATPPGFTQTLGEWTSLTSLPSPRSECSAVLIDTTVYILGGSEFSSAEPYPILRTGIFPDGTLSGWVEESCRPSEIHSEAVSFAHGGYLYLMSGSKGVTNTISTTIERASINSDGSLGAWEFVGYTPYFFYLSTWVQTTSDLYVIGGYSVDTNEFPGGRKTWRLPLYSNGSVGTWSLLSSKLNVGRYATAVTIVDDRIYLQGGRSEYGDYITAEVTQILPDGDLSIWQTLTKPLALHYTNMLAKIGKRLYSIAGCSPSWPDTDTESAEILSDYTLGTWVGLSPYPKERCFFAHVQTENGVYVFGGRVNSDMSSVQYAPIIPPSEVRESQWKDLE